MKKILFALAIVVTILPTISHLNAFNCVIPTDLGFRKITLRAGTTVILETTEKILSDQVTIGQLVQFKVKLNVYAEKKLAITTGALAIGRIKSITKTTYNLPESITIELVSAQAVDGQQVTLSGTEQTYIGKFTGEGTFVEPGKTISATVLNDIEINSH